MECSIHALSKLAGVSTRTLRYYDEIGLLEPLRVNSSKYRIYGEREVDRLQQILFFRELGLALDDIKAVVKAPDLTVKRHYCHTWTALPPRRRNWKR